MILFPYAGDTRGGSVQSSYLLIEELVNRGRTVRLVFHGEGYARDLAAERKLPFVDLPGLGTQPERARRDAFRLGNLLAASSCLQAIRQHRATLVHVNDKRMLRTWCLPTRASGRPLLTHWRSVYLPSWSVDAGLRLTSRILAVSSYSRDRLPIWAQAKTDVVYNPFKALAPDLNVVEARRRIRERAGIPRDAAVIGVFGALLARKRPHILLKLLERLSHTADGRPIHGVVCGEPLEPRDEAFFCMMQTGAWAKRIVLAGFVTNMAEWMAASDVMIAPAIDEPLARVGVEAQSAGLPAIVSSDGGLREVIEDGVSGLVVDPYDFEGWLTAVRNVLDNRILARRLIEGGRAAAAHLTLDRHADAVDAVYATLLRKQAA